MTNNSSGPTWRIIAIGSISIIVMMLSAFFVHLFAASRSNAAAIQEGDRKIMAAFANGIKTLDDRMDVMERSHGTLIQTVGRIEIGQSNVEKELAHLATRVSSLEVSARAADRTIAAQTILQGQLDQRIRMLEQQRGIRLPLEQGSGK